MSSILPRRLSAASVRRHVEITHGGDNQSFLSGLSDAMNQLMRSNLKRARVFAERLAALEPHFQATDRAFLQRLRARYYHLSGDSKRSLDLYRQAQFAYRRGDDPVAAARIGRAMVDVLMYLGRYQEALTAGRRAAETFRRNRMDTDRAHTLINIGNVYHRRDDNARALAAYDTAYTVLSPSGTNMAVAVVQFNRGNILTNLARLDEAARSYEDARRIYNELGMELAATQAEYSLAYLDFLQGDIAESLTRFETVLASFETLGDARGKAQTQLDMLEIQLHLNLHTVVEAGAPAVLRRFGRLGMRYEQAKCWYFLAKAQASVEELPAARKSIARARNLLGAEGNAVWDGSVNLLEARLLSLDRRHAEAFKLAQSALRAFRNARDPGRAAAATLFLANLDLKCNQRAKSRSRIEPLLRRDKQLPFAVAFEAWWLDGRRRRSAGDLDGAIHSYQNAVARAERMTAGIAPDESRIFFLTDKLAVYHELTALLIEKQRLASALNVLEDSRSVRRAEYWPAARGGTDRPLPRELERQQKELRARLHRLYGFPSSVQRFMPAQLTTVRKTEDRLWRLSHRARRLSGQTRQYARSNVPTRLGRLDAGRMVLAFTSDGEYPGAIILTASGIRYIRLQAPWQHLRDLLAQFYFFIEKNRIPGDFTTRHAPEIVSGANDILANISEVVIWPLMDRLQGVRDLTFVPFGILSAVPFHALPLPDGALLTDRFRVRHAVDVTSATGPQTASLPCNPEGAVFSPGLAGTGEMDAEADEIMRLFPHSRHFRGEGANRGQLRAALSSGASFLHIASHASAALDNPIFSEILLSDGPFYAFDLFGGRVRQTLVTLSACQTGRPGVLPSGEIYGLADAFLAQGAKSVLSSLWTVSDRTARVFMSEFYRYVKEGTGLNEAWTKTLTEMRRRFDNPCHWAPFVLIGVTG